MHNQMKNIFIKIFGSLNAAVQRSHVTLCVNLCMCFLKFCRIVIFLKVFMGNKQLISNNYCIFLEVYLCSLTGDTYVDIDTDIKFKQGQGTIPASYSPRYQNLPFLALLCMKSSSSRQYLCTAESTRHSDENRTTASFAHFVINLLTFLFSVTGNFSPANFISLHTTTRGKQHLHVGSHYLKIF